MSNSFPLKNERKRGALSDEEKGKIREMSREGKTPSQIADAINRNEAPVLRFLREDSAVNAKDADEIDVGLDEEKIILRNRLAGRGYWHEVRRQVSPSELHYFVECWILYMQQFGEDVVASEEFSLKDIIIIDILMNRSMAERKLTVEYIENLQHQLDEEMESGLPDMARVAELEEKVNIARSTLTNYTTEHVKLLEKKNALHRELKATRDQRFQKIEDNPTTFSHYMKWLKDEENRKRVGEEMEMMKVAKEREKKRLAEIHIYGDGKADLPLLTADTYLSYKEKEKQEEDNTNE